MPTPGEVKALFRAYLRLGKQFPNYNIRHYLTRRAKEEFHAIGANADAALAERAWQKAQGEFEVWKRQSVVYQLYGRRIKTVLEVDAAATHPQH